MSEPVRPSRLIARHKWLELYAGFNDEPFVVSGPGVVVVPVNYAGEVLLITAPTIPGGPDERVLTLPGGAIDAGETPAQAAHRALAAATGFRAEVLFPLGILTPLARHVRWDLHLFLGRNLVPARAIGDAIFQIAVERVPFAQWERLLSGGRLRDSSLIAALVLAGRFVAGQLRVERGQGEDESDRV